MLSMITGYFQSRPLRTKSQLRMTPVTGENLPARTRAEVWMGSRYFCSPVIR